jgi:L-alanine-DL-glutamate epimerase-like enolase superfamily enzyme
VELSGTIAIEKIEVNAYRVPLRERESDATLVWDHTPLVVVHAYAGGLSGLGYTYGTAAVARLIDDELTSVVVGLDALAVAHAWRRMLERVRNIGRTGVAAYAIAAVDAALWDLEAKLLGLPLARLLGQVREDVAIYASGGFTSMDVEGLVEQLGAWVDQGITQVKMKVGREPSADGRRVAAVRTAIGDAELFVDANGGYTPKQALAFAERFAELGVRWFEEPVSSDDLAGLRLVRERGPAGLSIAAGEYGNDPWYFRRMLEAEAVDVLQLDAARALGVSAALQVDALCLAHHVPLSLHTAPAYHLHLAAALASVVHVEWFHDHVDVEQALFDGAPVPERGVIRVDHGRPGNGLALRRREAQRHAV